VEILEAPTNRADEQEGIVAQALGVDEQEPMHMLIRRRTGNGERLALVASDTIG
jgi:hypothetical protein